MAALTENDRVEIWAKWMRENAEMCGTMTKAEFRAAVDAVDQWTEDNTASFNTSIPQPARGALTTQQKARLFMEIVTRRFLSA